MDAASLSALDRRPALRRESLDVRAGRHYVDRFHQTARGPAGTRRTTWDLLIVDEAHQSTAGSLRYEPFTALAARARHVVLLTATPHAGDDHAYHALCAIGVSSTV